MTETISASTREFLEWLAIRPRTYDEAMEAWRTSCPRYSIWEDSEIEGLIRIQKDAVTLTDKGRSALNGASLR